LVGHSYDNADIALTCGLMLRECIRHEALSRYVLMSDLFYRFFEYVEVANFDVASDAFATFKDLLVLHKQMSASFLEANYARV
jgi:calcium binding protein 39